MPLLGHSGDAKGELQAAEGSWASSAATRRVMLANRSRDTGPEVAIRRLLFAAGLRYRVDYRLSPPLRIRADLVFKGPRIAVFIDGCFWHGCEIHYVAPKSNTTYWSEKLAGNVSRDRATDVALEEQGWTVLRYWEHVRPEDAAAEIIRAVRLASCPSREVSGNTTRTGNLLGDGSAE